MSNITKGVYLTAAFIGVETLVFALPSFTTLIWIHRIILGGLWLLFVVLCVRLSNDALNPRFSDGPRLLMSIGLSVIVSAVALPPVPIIRETTSRVRLV